MQIWQINSFPIEILYQIDHLQVFWKYQVISLVNINMDVLVEIIRMEIKWTLYEITNHFWFT